MAQIEIKDLSFKYPLGKTDALKNISLTVKNGEYVVICGKSGCGKTTLLRQIKSVIAPKGKKSGCVLIDGADVSGLGVTEQAQKIGFVMQDPENQIVTDKVWHELAFGLENIGLKRDEIRLRSAEMASYFGIGSWFDRDISTLSGGQKQLLNLAAVMAMRPEVLILDEPTSQLDPVAADSFLSVINKINKELGVSVIITEHRLEEVISCADRIAVLENGEKICDCEVSQLGNYSKELEPIKDYLPAAVKIFCEFQTGECPVTVRDARNRLIKICGGETLEIKRETQIKPKESCVKFKNVSFRYDKNSDDILKNMSVDIPSGCIFGVTGENGAGKSTFLKLTAGILKAYSGKIEICGKKIEKYNKDELYNSAVSYLPQDTRLVFTKSSIKEELQNGCRDDEKIKKAVELTDIESLLDMHPYDVSGGERQRAALAKLLLKDTKIILLDEPTKGMDAEFKKAFAKILYSLKDENKTVIMISHDIEFLAQYSDYCSMIFDKGPVCVMESKEFFANNSFYTTAACRISKGIIKNAVTCEDVIKCLKENSYLPQ